MTLWVEVGSHSPGAPYRFSEGIVIDPAAPSPRPAYPGQAVVVLMAGALPDVPRVTGTGSVSRVPARVSGVTHPRAGLLAPATTPGMEAIAAMRQRGIGPRACVVDDMSAALAALLAGADTLISLTLSRFSAIDTLAARAS